jgi:protein TonB
MDSPRLGFRRATVTSWVLVGIGAAGVAGASSLAYADTFRPPLVNIPVDAAVPTELAPPPPAENLPPGPQTVEPAAPPATIDAPTPEVTLETTVDQPPVSTYQPVPEYTPAQTVEQAPVPVTNQTPTPKATVPPTTQRRLTAPTTVNSPNYSRPVTRSGGS